MKISFPNEQTLNHQQTTNSGHREKSENPHPPLSLADQMFRNEGDSYNIDLVKTHCFKNPLVLQQPAAGA